jgi:hypothetical protein
VREALSELDDLLFSEARPTGWEHNRPAENAALAAARRRPG